jgi:hypothetical protein
LDYNPNAGDWENVEPSLRAIHKYADPEIIPSEDQLDPHRPLSVVIRDASGELMPYNL